jgi:hypothetical protein
MNILEWGDISNAVYIMVVMLGIIQYTMIFHLDKINTSLSKSFNKTMFTCASKCVNKKDCEFVNALRDDYYYMQTTGDSESLDCKITRWEISHFFTHIFLGYFSNIYISQGISVGFELYEHYALNCGSYLDLGYNFAGFMVGHTLKNYINRTKI